MYVRLENVYQKASKFDDIEIIFGLFFALFVRQLLRIRALLQFHCTCAFHSVESTQTAQQHNEFIHTGNVISVAQTYNFMAYTCN